MASKGRRTAPTPRCDRKEFIVRVDGQTAAALEAVADGTNTSANAIVNLALQAYLPTYAGLYSLSVSNVAQLDDRYAATINLLAGGDPCTTTTATVTTTATAGGTDTSG